MKALIMVAGYATRMYPLTLNKPKALLPLGGRPVIDYIVDQVNRLPTVDQIYIVSNHKFYTHFKKWSSTVASAIPVEVLDDDSMSDEDKRGAIGDIFFTLQEKKIDDDILVIAGDNYFTYDLRTYYDFYIDKNHDTVCAGYINDREQLKHFAVALLDNNGKVLSLVEKPSEPPSNTAVYATYFYKKETLPLFKTYLDAGYNPDAPGYFPQWLHTVKDVYAYVFTEGECHDIGTIAAYEAVNQTMRSK